MANPGREQVELSRRQELAGKRRRGNGKRKRAKVNGGGQNVGGSGLNREGLAGQNLMQTAISRVEPRGFIESTVRHRLCQQSAQIVEISRHPELTSSRTPARILARPPPHVLARPPRAT